MWYQLQVENCRPDKIEQLSEELEKSGALSITLTDKNDNPVLEPDPGTTPLWPEVIMNALYSEEMPAMQAIQQLTSLHDELTFRISTLEDQDWIRAGMDNFKPQRFGQRLWICPSWHTPPEPGAINLMLDPGLAFGTGTHPTTNLCLTWLEQNPIKGKTLIDYGCGSGILALAALKLGAARVEAVDIDPQALLATRNNAETNDLLSEQLLIAQPENIKHTADILIANILLAPLITLRERLCALVNKDSTIVVSGLLREQAEILIDSWQKDFMHQQTLYLEDWALLVFTPRT